MKHQCVKYKLLCRYEYWKYDPMTTKSYIDWTDWFTVFWASDKHPWTKPLSDLKEKIKDLKSLDRKQKLKHEYKIEETI